MSTLKSLEKAKNVYFAYINKKFKKYNILDHFNMNFLERLNYYFSKLYYQNNNLKQTNEYQNRIKEFFVK